MSLIACGISHKTAPLALREKIVFAPEELSAPLLELVDQQRVREAAILSTCNRTEIYCETDKVAQVLDWFKARPPFNSSIITPCLYWYTDQAAVQHALRVASGLDSMVLGEPQILGQMKAAIASAQQIGTLGHYLNRLFQYVFAITKRVRSHTTIGANPISIVYAAISLAKRIFADFTATSVLLIGAGDTIELAAKYLSQQGVKHLTIANRTLHRAKQLVKKHNGVAIMTEDIPKYLPKIDMIIAATASTLPILGKGAVERAIKIRKHRPMLIVDLAVPRDVEPEVAELPDVYLYTLDDLHSVIEENIQSRRQAAQQAEALIELHATNFMRYLRSLDAVSTVRAYRDKMVDIRDKELEKALRELQQGIAPEKVLNNFARIITNKFMHGPSVQLRMAAANEQQEMLALIRQLFDL